MDHSASLSQLAAQLRAHGKKLTERRVVTGFDGFVDEIISVVDERQNLSTYRKVPDMSRFSALIAQAAGHSSLREIVVERMEIGGCAINLGDGLASLGVKVDCFATMGEPRHPAFDQFAQKMHGCHSWGKEYGRTLAFEFEDGKLMYRAVSQLAEFDLHLLDKVLAEGIYQQACQQAAIIALTDWTLYPHMTACWQKLQHEVYAKLKHRPYFFFDLVDPSSRSAADIREMLHVLADFEKYGSIVLGLNGNEANILSQVLGLELTGKDPDSTTHQAAQLREKLNISQVLIHHRKYAAVATAQHACHAHGPFCAAPKKSTGAGDRFNAGYCTGLLLDLDLPSCLNLASACTGFFVRQARSATLTEFANFIENWAHNNADQEIIQVG